MKNLQKFENFDSNTTSNNKVELDGWAVAETMEHTDGYNYHRCDSNEAGVEWFEEGYANNYDGLIKDDELATELEEAYQASGQGYAHIWSKK